MTARRLIVGFAALLLAITVVRNSAVDALSQDNPALAFSIWGGHPAAELNLGMTDIARSARLGRAAPPEAFRLISDAARKSPLAPEPYLVKGVQAQVAGPQTSAEQAFLAAEWRDPRSLSAHYFLAAHFFQAGNAERGLKEVASLANLSPQGVASSAPFIAAFARDPSNWPRVRALFRTNPEIRDATLVALAQDEANAPAIMALTPASDLNAGSNWLPVLLNSMVTAGDYAKARAIWAAVSRIGPASRTLLFDPDFSNPGPPPPFNWILTSSTVGLAERLPGGRLHAIYYGQEDGVLAKQLLVLPPGRYELSMRLLPGASQPKALNWALMCPSAQTPLASVPLDVAASRGWTFEVPPGCAAQWLQLSGVSADLPQQSDITISGLRLAGEGVRG